MQFFQNCKGLQFDEKPNYNLLRNLFKSIANKFEYEFDNIFDWNLKKVSITYNKYLIDG